MLVSDLKILFGDAVFLVFVYFFSFFPSFFNLS